MINIKKMFDKIEFNEPMNYRLDSYDMEYDKERNDSAKQKHKINEAFVKAVIDVIKIGDIHKANGMLISSDIDTVMHIVSVLNKDYDLIDPNSWIWVEGYKATEKDMSCRDYKFDIGKVHTIEGEVIECENGFHLCSRLEKVFNYYDINSNPYRYFKVKALVNEREYYEEQNQVYFVNYSDEIIKARGGGIKIKEGIGVRQNSKLVAKSILFREELSFEELEEYINKGLRIDSKEKWVKAQEYGDYIELNKEDLVDKLTQSGLSQLIATILVDNLGCNHIERRWKYSDGYMSTQLYSNKSDEVINFVREANKLSNKIVGLLESGVSMDMCIYMIKDYL